MGVPGDRDRDGVTDELEITVTAEFDGDDSPGAQRADFLARMDAMKRDGVVADYRIVESFCG